MSEEIRQEKKRLRKEILKKRKEMAEKEREMENLLLTERILGHQWFYRCQDFLCFVSYGTEVETRPLIREALGTGKRVFVPKVEKPTDKPVMEFYRITSLEELKTGYHGIEEPSGESEAYRYTEETAEKALLLMPGVAFDAYGNRLGYGGGFYDAYLADKPGLQIKSVGICYRCQRVGELPVEETDRKPYQVISC